MITRRAATALVIAFASASAFISFGVTRYFERPRAITPPSVHVDQDPVPEAARVERRGDAISRSAVAARSFYARLAGLEKRLTRLEQTARVDAVERAVHQEKKEEWLPDSDWYATAEDELDYRTQRIESHLTEVVDAYWAADAEVDFRADLESLQSTVGTAENGGGLSVASLSCRSTTCLASLEWPSQEAATRSAETLAMHSYTQNCGIDIMMPSHPVDAQGDPYVHDVLFYCGENDSRGN